MKHWILFALLFPIITLGPYRECEAKEHSDGTLSVVLENDMFYNVDQHYTNGVGFIWVPSRDKPTPEWVRKVASVVPWIPREGELLHGYAFGQSMFTPADTDATNPPQWDRPYAGWLYGLVGMGVATGQRLDLLSLSVGIVGPASLAEQTQKAVHELRGIDVPKGWDTQLHNEPAVVLTYQLSKREWATTTWLGNRFDITPHVGGAIGNVFTYANAGFTLRYGEQLPNDFGPPRIQPGLLGSAEFAPTKGFNWYVFAGFEGRAVARNIFLDGNTFRDSRSVDKKSWVGDLQFGLVLDWPGTRLSYTHVRRTKEFNTQGKNDEFGALSVSIKF